MKRLSYWTFLSKELLDLKKGLSDFFDSNDLERDYENVWEWMEDTSNKYPGKLNISRVHNWESGEYDKPIIITADYLTEFNVSQEKIDEIVLL